MDGAGGAGVWKPGSLRVGVGVGVAGQTTGAAAAAADGPGREDPEPLRGKEGGGAGSEDAHC